MSNSTSPFFIQHVDTMGSLVDLSESEFVVIASFSRSVYLQNEFGKIICITNPDLPIGPYSIPFEQWRKLQFGITIGEKWFSHDSTLRFQKLGEKYPLIQIDTKNCRYLQHESLWKHSFDAVNEGIKSVRNFCKSDDYKNKEISPLLYKILCLPMLVKTENTVFLEELTKGVTTLCSWLNIALQLNEIDSVNEFCSIDSLTNDVANMLIGLGPGLTPSGDDILVGAMIALHAFGKKNLVSKLGEIILSVGKQATNKISLAYLSAATQGHSSEALHQAINSIFLGKKNVSDSLQCLYTVGHSSGWDAFLGVLCVITSMLQKNCIEN